MNKRVLIILGIVVALVCALMIGSVAGGGIIYSWLYDAQPAYAAQIAEPDPDAGLIVTSVEKDGPASKAGIVRGDILQSINGHDVNSMVDVMDILEDLEAGDDVLLTVLHGDELRSLNVSIEEGRLGGKLDLSLCCGTVTPIEIKHIEILNGKPLIVRVQKGSPAEKAGLEPGELILTIDGDEIDFETSLSEWISRYEAGDQIQLEVRNLREDETRSISVELGEHPEKVGQAYLGVQVIQTPRVLDTFEEDLPLHEFRFNVPPTDEEGFPFFFFHRDKSDQPWSESISVRGVIVVDVIEDSPASKAGLEDRDVITALDGEEIEGPKVFADTISSMQPGEKVSLTIYRASSDETIDLQVTLGEHPENPETGYLGVQIRGVLQINHFDEEYRFERWLPFLDQFRFPFQFERRFQIPRSEEF